MFFGVFLPQRLTDGLYGRLFYTADNSLELERKNTCGISLPDGGNTTKEWALGGKVDKLKMTLGSDLGSSSTASSILGSKVSRASRRSPFEFQRHGKDFP